MYDSKCYLALNETEHLLNMLCFFFPAKKINNGSEMFLWPLSDRKMFFPKMRRECTRMHDGKTEILPVRKHTVIM